MAGFSRNLLGAFVRPQSLMPIYDYRCDHCGLRKDVLQKIADPVLTQCPECGQQTFKRVLSAPAFQLKGSGWYVTDFRDNGKARADKGKAADGDSAKADAAKGSADASGGDGGSKETGGSSGTTGGSASDAGATKTGSSDAGSGRTSAPPSSD